MRRRSCAADGDRLRVSRATTPTDFSAHVNEEVRHALHGLSSEDSREAVRAMITKEAPHFQGR